MEPEILDPSQALDDADAAGLHACCFPIIFNKIIGGGVLVLLYRIVIFSLGSFGPRGICLCLETFLIFIT